MFVCMYVCMYVRMLSINRFLKLKFAKILRMLVAVHDSVSTNLVHFLSRFIRQPLLSTLITSPKYMYVYKVSINIW